MAMRQNLSAEIAKKERVIALGLARDYFPCRAPKEERSPDCTGLGYRHGREIGVCSVCLTFLKESGQFIG